MSRNLSFNLKDVPDSSFPSPWKIPLPVWGILMASLLIKLALITLNRGEYTDGIVQLELWRSPVVFFPPAYSAAVWGIDLIINRLFGSSLPDSHLHLLISGRLVSILASVGSLWICYRLARLVLADEKGAFLATLFFALSPVFNRWSLRVMTDSLFLLLFLICCFQFIRLLHQSNRSPVRFLGWIGLAALVRYQGFFFLPLAIFLLWKRRRTIIEQGFARQIAPILAALMPWLLLVWWVGFRGFGHTQQFMERGSYGFWLTLSLYFSMFETFVLYWPWAITYGLFLAGIPGIWHLFNDGERERNYAKFFLIAVLVFLIVHSCFLSFQYRYLLPLVPLWSIAAARGWMSWEKSILNPSMRIKLLSLILANLVVMTAAVLYFQRATFGDLTASAEFLRSAKFQRMVSPGARILSDELYREGVYNIKMQFWAGNGREILYYPQTEPQTGDVIILHNAYTDLTKAKEQLEQRFGLQVLQTWSSGRGTIWDDFVTLPLLPDIMVNPPTLPLTSNPPCMAFRFAPQGYYSVALMLKGK